MNAKRKYAKANRRAILLSKWRRKMRLVRKMSLINSVLNDRQNSQADLKILTTNTIERLSRQRRQ